VGRIERAPDWILKYKERIEKGAITVEDILEAENRIRAEPIKISSVTRAISAMGYPITGLRRGKKTETDVKEEKKEEPVKVGAETGRIERGPSWLQNYREGIEKKTITVEGILEAESRIRAEPIKMATVARAINAMGYPLTGLQKGRKEEAEVKKEKPVEKREVAERIERGPGWLQKYRERIEKGTITVEDILEEENRIRKVPIKLITVTRAINAMGYPLTGLRRGGKEEAEVKKEKPVEKREGAERVERGPGWLQKYRERIEKKTITVEDILEEENRIRAEPIKISSVTRAINTMGYPLTDLRRGGKEEVKKVEKPKKAGMAEVYASSIGKLSEATENRFNAIKKSWEKDLDKSLPNDYFVNILLALAKLVEHGKTLAPAK
jgi:diacylglycerol kinase